MKRKWLIVWLTGFLVLCLCAACGKDDKITNQKTEIESRDDTGSGDHTDSSENVTKDRTDDTSEEAVAEQESTEEPEEIVLDEDKAVSVWTTVSLNLRKAPGTSSPVLKVLKKAEEVKKYEEKDGWVLVKAGDIVGYVSGKYLASQKPAEQSSAVRGDDGSQSASKVETIPGQHRETNSAVVVIDPGHQRKGDSTKEPNGPGSSVMKARVTYGATGVATGMTEYALNLDISLKLRIELENRGYTVYMTRTTHDVNISNKERAEYGNSVGADAVVRVHANSASGAAKGAETLVPSSSNPYVSHLASAS